MPKQQRTQPYTLHSSPSTRDNTARDNRYVRIPYVPTGLGRTEFGNDLIGLVVSQVRIGTVFRRNVLLQVLSVLHDMVWYGMVYLYCLVVYKGRLYKVDYGEEP
jgi:hypothetical protein